MRLRDDDDLRTPHIYIADQFDLIIDLMLEEAVVSKTLVGFLDRLADLRGDGRPAYIPSDAMCTGQPSIS